MERTQIKAIEKPLLLDDMETIIPVCAYCRVSTDAEEQKNSLENQKKYFDYFFEKHKNWSRKTIFADEGISGTSLKKRDQFNRMIAEAKGGGYRIILTKEVSRFSRNIQDTLNIVSELLSKGIYVFFINDEIYTEDSEEKVREKLIACANQAEAESRKTSRRVRWGHEQRARDGVTFGRKEMYGYEIKRDAAGSQYYEINEEQAQVVRKVFELYAAGFGTFRIARYLEANSIPTFRFKQWTNTVILRMLRNEKYVGDLRTNKTYTVNSLTHQKKANKGEANSYYFTNHHVPIVDREVWLSVQKKLQESSPDEETKQKHSNRYWLSGKIFCGECGSRYISRKKTTKGGGKYKAWVCFENQNHGLKKDNGMGCDNKCVNERVLYQGMYDIITQILRPQLEDLTISQRKEKKKVDIEKKVNDIIEKQARLTKLYLDGKITEQAFNITNDGYIQEIQQLKEKEESNRHDEKVAFLQEQLKRAISFDDTKLNEELFGTLIEKIVVFENHILDFYINGLINPIRLQWRTNGRRLQNFDVEFTVIQTSE